MSIYESNTGSIAIPGNSLIYSINSNCGTTIVGPNCKISECNNNCGVIELQHGLCIGQINNNCGRIEVANGSKIDSIVNNCGNIILASDCVLLNTENNVGSIVRGRHNVDSGANSSREHNNHYNDRNIFNAGGSSNSTRATWSAIFDSLNLGWFGGGLLNMLNLVLPSKGKKDASISSADSKENCSVPTDALPNDDAETLCVICMERPKKVAFQCGHLCCANCSEKLLKCHMCRSRIVQKIYLFL